MQRKIIRIDVLPSDAVESATTKNLYLTRSGKVYGQDLKGPFEILTYINNWTGVKHGYVRFHFNSKIYFLHKELALLFVPGRDEEHNCVDHIDNNSLNNDIANLQWISRSANSKKYWDSLTPEEMAKQRSLYSEGLRRAHAEGHYKDHLDKIHKQRTLNKKTNKNI